MSDRRTITILQNEVIRLNGIICLMKREHNELQRAINDIYADAVKYPQLKLPEYILERLQNLVK